MTLDTPIGSGEALVVRPATSGDAGRLARLRADLFPDSPPEEHVRDLERFFAGRAREPLEILVATDDRGRPIGFCELSIRAYAEGCRTDRVGYLEAWYVVPEARRRGIGRRLIAAAESWARRQGCTEMGSDARADNHLSAAAHAGLGFAETGLVRCFRKELRAPATSG